jgi:hypothetical protein
MTEQLYEALLFMISGRKARRRSPKMFYQRFGFIKTREENIMLEVKIDNLLIADMNKQYDEMKAKEQKKAKKEVK